MPPIAPTFTPLEWRQLAHACQVVAEKERARAAEIGGTAARGLDFVRDERDPENLVNMAADDPRLARQA